METTIKKIYNSALKFLVPLTLEELYETIVHEAMKLVKASFGTISLVKDGRLTRVYASSPLLYKIQPRKRGFTYRVYKTNKPMIVTADMMTQVHPELEELQACSDIMIPLSYRNQSIGVLSALAPKEEKLDQESIDVLKLFGSMATLAIRKTQLYNETKRALEVRDLFISMAAHELRTPITTIYGYAQLLEQKTAALDTIESKWIKELHSEVLRLSLLVNDLLEINRIRAGHTQYILKQCVLTEIAERAVANFSFNHSDRKIIIKNNLDGKKSLVIGDFDKLLQVVINLLDNAAKFSTPETTIKVHLRLVKSYLSLVVEDKGKGIPKEDLQRVFEDFYRGQDLVGEGMGLGLYLAKNIIEKHHGFIKLSSQVNKGTKVEIFLPKSRI